MEYLQYISPDGKCPKTGYSFKPYYNWNTFNTLEISNDIKEIRVLNLIITGIPSIQKKIESGGNNIQMVLNLVVNGIPSIRKKIYDL